jgi:hypothetical protein
MPSARSVPGARDQHRPRLHQRRQFRLRYYSGPEFSYSVNGDRATPTTGSMASRPMESKSAFHVPADQLRHHPRQARSRRAPRLAALSRRRPHQLAQGARLVHRSPHRPARACAHPLAQPHQPPQRRALDFPRRRLLRMPAPHRRHLPHRLFAPRPDLPRHHPDPRRRLHRQVDQPDLRRGPRPRRGRHQRRPVLEQPERERHRPARIHRYAHRPVAPAPGPRLHRPHRSGATARRRHHPLPPRENLPAPVLRQHQPGLGALRLLPDGRGQLHLHQRAARRRDPPRRLRHRCPRSHLVQLESRPPLGPHQRLFLRHRPVRRRLRRRRRPPPATTPSSRSAGTTP